MTEQRVDFDDSEAYERFMGRWSRAIGTTFLGWLAPTAGARWLDVGCGTGAFTELVEARCSPASIVAVDPSAAQIAGAEKRGVAKRAEFRTADAQALPFADAEFDVVASALVINFIADRNKALAEMCRVVRPGGTVAGYVWDFSAGRASGWPLQRGLRAAGMPMAEVPGAADTSLEALVALFKRAGLERMEARPIDVTGGYTDFEDLWQAQTPAFSPIGKQIASLTEPDRAKVKEAVRAQIEGKPDGSISYDARANAIMARRPS